MFAKSIWIISAIFMSLSLHAGSFNWDVLKYPHGGHPEYNPCKTNANYKCYYIDPIAGNDKNNGRRPAMAKQSIDAEILSVIGNSDKSSRKNVDKVMLLFKRGTIYTKNLSIANIAGDRHHPFVIGAYGASEDHPPVISKGVRLVNSEFVTIRDLEAPKVFLVLFNNNILIFNNLIRGSKSNGIYIAAGSHHTVVAKNFVYDIGANDGISIHDINWKLSEDLQEYLSGEGFVEAGPHHWIIDNTVIGNEHMEDGIDVARGDTLYDYQGNYKGESFKEHAKRSLNDVKILQNNILGLAIEIEDPVKRGYKTLYHKDGGQSAFGINSGHFGDYSWIKNNIVGYTRNAGISLKHNSGDEKSSLRKNAIMSHNIVFEAGGNILEGKLLNPKPSFIVGHENILVKNNTIVRDEISPGSMLSSQYNGRNLMYKDNILSYDTSKTMVINDKLRKNSPYYILEPGSLRKDDYLEDRKYEKGFENKLTSDKMSYYLNPSKWSAAWFRLQFVNKKFKDQGALNSAGEFRSHSVFPIPLAKEDLSVIEEKKKVGDGYCGWEGFKIITAGYNIKCQKK